MQLGFLLNEVEVVKVAVCQMLAESITPFGSGTKDGSEACGRGDSGWDDED